MKKEEFKGVLKVVILGLVICTCTIVTGVTLAKIMLFGVLS